ncbi:hypothetical protein [Aminobacter aminovorans]|uniref:hypothetical protein n=1 Tax=Aminobacter aminovorans TaxID=83263 RepID=UPI00285AD1F6|nr:hypothetical protein [Aminobacter aminovorans]MDR7219938.1 hypothetical protein [Aminobacter aminovorans]
MIQPLNDDDLDAIEDRARRASAGPWKSYIEGRDHLGGSSFIMVGEGLDRRDDIELTGATAADQDFIAEARQDIVALVAEVRALRALLK